MKLLNTLLILLFCFSVTLAQAGSDVSKSAGTEKKSVSTDLKKQTKIVSPKTNWSKVKDLFL